MSKTAVLSRDTLVLNGTAHSIFIIGSVLSVADSLTTWIVLRQTGLSKEGNTWMAAAMQSFGLSPVCVLRSLVGIIAFWFLARHVANVYVWQSDRRRRRLARWESPTNRFDRAWRWWDRHSASTESVVAITVTAMIVGNNLRAVAQLAGWVH